MQRGIIWATAAALLILCTGCAGKDFVRPSENSLGLGKTTLHEIQQRFGEPRHEGSGVENEKTIRTFAYSYAGGAGGLVGGVIPARAMIYSFCNDILIGYQFVSSFSEDSTDFNDAKINQIEKGRTREDEVIDLIGKPSGRFIYPIADKDGMTLGYVYSETRGPTPNMKFYRKNMKINLNQDGIVTDLKFSSSESK